MPTLLLVEDDPTVGDVLADYLRHAGHDVTLVTDGPAALAAAVELTPDLVLLDLMLPGINGLEVCRRLRRNAPTLPIIMVTARGEEQDRVLGLQLGADDYVTKPFSMRELGLRITSVLRRSGAPGEPDANAIPAVLVDGDLVLDPSAVSTTLAGRPLTLTNRESDLLAFFLRNPGRVFSRDELMREVWGWEFGDQSTVTVHVRRLREKVETEPGMPTRIVTVFGRGYRFDPVTTTSTPAAHGT